MPADRNSCGKLVLPSGYVIDHPKCLQLAVPWAIPGLPDPPVFSVTLGVILMPFEPVFSFEKVEGTIETSAQNSRKDQ